jgi:hypothetical protein
MAGVEKSLAIRHFEQITVEIPLKRDGIRCLSPAKPNSIFSKKRRNFKRLLVINFLMNNVPLQNEQRQVRELLSKLPNAPVASNFTARVLQAIDAAEARPPRWHLMAWNWRAFFPRATVTAAAAGIAAIGLYQHELSVQRQNFARSVVAVASQPMPSVDALKNFDAIQRMGQTARPDDDLLALASDMK